MATVNPREVGERWNFCVRARVTPATTAVSNPKRRPPREAVIVLSTTVLLSGTFAAAPGSITTLARSTKGLTSENLSQARRYTAHQRAEGRGRTVLSIPQNTHGKNEGFADLTQTELLECGSHIVQRERVGHDWIERKAHREFDRRLEVLAFIDPGAEQLNLFEIDGLHIHFNRLLEDTQVDDHPTWANQSGHLPR